MTTHYLSIDIESVGDRFDHSVIAIGACFGPVDGSWPRAKLVKFRANLKPLPGDTQDPRCMQEFWSTQAPDVYQEITAKAEDAAIAMNKFLLFCQQLVALYEDDPNSQGKIEIVTDCPDLYPCPPPSFLADLMSWLDSDLGRLHYLGEVATKTWPTPIRSLGKPNARHGQVDPGERLDALGQWGACEAWIKRNVPGVVHDHRPENDAEHSYYQMVFMNRKGADLVMG
jgi:hypothetical protein